MPTAYATFTGLSQIISWEFTFGHGPFPSTGRISVPPHTAALPSGGTFTIVHGNGQPITFPDCVVENASLRAGAEGFIWDLTFVDRRWRWRHGAIDGRYNVPVAKNTWQREKTPQELASLCLDAMGEQDYDVSQVPNFGIDPAVPIRPQVEWRADNPAEALGRLCDELGCRIVLELDNHVRIVRHAEGAALPALSGVDRQLTFTRGGVPNVLRAVCAPIRYQAMFALEAVGIETDAARTIKPIDELSYKPAAGWGLVGISSDAAVTQTYFGPNGELLYARDLAKQCLWRMYRIKNVVGVTDFDPPGSSLPGVVAREDVLPLFGELNEIATLDLFKRPVYKPAYVGGFWHIWGNATHFVSQSTGGFYTRSFHLDESTGILTFENYTLKIAADGTRSAADIYLVATCEVTDPMTGIKKYFSRDKQFGPLVDPKPRLVHAPEIVVRYIPTYQNRVLVNLAENLNESITQALDKIDQAARDLNGTEGGAVRLENIYPLELDGAIQQVTWSGGPGGYYTLVSRNVEVKHLLTNHEARRKKQSDKARGVKQDFDKLLAVQIRRALSNQAIQ